MTAPTPGSETPLQEEGRLPIQRSDSALAAFRHDLMTPINLILGYTEMLEEELADPDDKRRLADLGKIKAATRRLMELIDENMRRGVTVGEACASPPVPPAPAPALSELPHAEPPSLARQAGESFLVVDDDEENRGLLTRLLSRNGYECFTAVNGREALDWLARRPFDLVLLDVQMPEMDGLELLDRLKEDAAWRHIPVIMVSAFTELENTARCIKRGAEDYLPKPFNSTLLLARVSACLEKKRLRDNERAMYQALAQSQQALAAELKEAAAHVRGLLPAPWKGDPRIDWRYVPSTILGGDAFGYHALDEEHMSVFLLDVCGHGVSAALHSISVMNAIRARSLPGADFHDPASVMRALNRSFQMAEHNNMYFTVWYGVYHRPSRSLAYSSAGHPPAVLVSEDDFGPCARKLATGGPIVGMMPDIQFNSARLIMPEGSRLFIFSDGAYELARPGGGMLTFDEFVDSLAPLGSEDDSELDQVLQRARAVRGGETFEDDLSIIEIRF